MYSWNHMMRWVKLFGNPRKPRNSQVRKIETQKYEKGEIFIEDVAHGLELHSLQIFGGALLV